MKLVIDLTAKCNLQCKHCGNLFSNGLEIKDLEEKIEEIPFKIESVDLLGGEPLLYSKIFAKFKQKVGN